MTSRTGRGYAATGGRPRRDWRGTAIMDAVLETLTGLGLATSAGLNAYIPLLMVGLMSRYTHLITLPPAWHWLANPGVVAIIGALLLVEVIADKIPVVDHVNDVVQTLVRPTAGGLVFGAASTSQTATVTDPSSFFSSNQWVPIAAGVIVSFLVHSTKAAARPVINASTVGFGAPIVSTIEDVVSVAMSAVAIILPALIVVFLIALIVIFFRVRRWRRRRKAEKLARQTAARTPPGPHDGRTLDLRG
jgi:hypothetical protein